MSNRATVVGYCSLAALAALYVVGAVSHGSLRHAVQTLPLWFSVVWGLRQRDVAKWAALPCFVIWLTLMIFIWLFLLGWARIISGHFSPVEIAMTLIVGAACAVGIGAGVRWRTAVSAVKAGGVTVLFAALQLAALRISFIPDIANR